MSAASRSAAEPHNNWYAEVASPESDQGRRFWSIIPVPHNITATMSAMAGQMVARWMSEHGIIEDDAAASPITSATIMRHVGRRPVDHRFQEHRPQRLASPREWRHNRTPRASPTTTQPVAAKPQEHAGCGEHLDVAPGGLE
jgi:hypothetical protein